LSDTQQKLKEMAQLSVFANRISEVQEKNLKHFPFVFFEKVQEASIDYDLGHSVDEEKKEIHHKSFVTYYLTLDPNPAINTNIAKRILALEVSVRKLFWSDIKLELHINGKKIYESKQ
jgi:hypothetical protein